MMSRFSWDTSWTSRPTSSGAFSIGESISDSIADSTYESNYPYGTWFDDAESTTTLAPVDPEVASIASDDVGAEKRFSASDDTLIGPIKDPRDEPIKDPRISALSLKLLSQSPVPIAPPPAELPAPLPKQELRGHDPGWRQYTVLLGAFCALFASFGWRSASGLFQEYYQLNQLRDDDPSTIAWINSVGFFLVYFGAVIVNPLAAKFGPRIVIFVGSCMHVAGLFATSFSTKFYQFLLAQGVLSSLGASALFFSSVTTMGRWFSKRQGLTVGIMASGTSAGGVVFPFVLSTMLPRIGFAWTLRIVVLIIFILCGIATATIRLPPPNHPGMKGKPLPSGLKNRLKDLKKRNFRLAVAGATAFANGYFLVLVFVASIARLRGWQDQYESIILLNAASFFGRILPGIVADKFGNFNTMITITALSAVTIFGLWIPGNNVRASVAFSVLYGFFSGSCISLGPGIMFQLSEPHNMGNNMMIYYVAQSVVALVVTPIGGALLSAGSDGTNPIFLQVFGGLFSVLGVLFLTLSRQCETGGAWKKKV